MKRNFLFQRSNDQMKRKLWEFLKEIPDDSEYIVTVEKKRNIRSLQANKFYWAVMKIYAMETGHTESEIELMFKMDRHYEIVEYPGGRTQKIPLKTSDLDTKQFSSLVNNLLQWGRELFPEVIIPRQEDLTYLQWLELNNRYDQSFSG